MFRAWRGELYGQADNPLRGLRLMVLGESHYSDRHPVGAVVPDMTEWVGDHYLAGDLGAAGKRFCTAVCKVIGQGCAPDAAPRDIWRSIVFYNYIPVVLADGPHRQRPSGELWARGRDPFFEVMKRLEAEAVLVLGAELWRHMEPSHEPAQSFLVNGQTRWSRRYGLHGAPERSPYRTVTAHVPHPTGSRGFSARRWAPVVEHLAREVAQERRRLDGRLRESAGVAEPLVPRLD